MSLKDTNCHLKSASSASLALKHGASLSSTGHQHHPSITRSQLNKELPPLPPPFYDHPSSAADSAYKPRRSRNHAASFSHHPSSAAHNRQVKNLKTLSRLNHSSPQILQRPPRPPRSISPFASSSSSASDSDADADNKDYSTDSDDDESYIMTLSQSNPFRLFSSTEDDEAMAPRIPPKNNSRNPSTSSKTAHTRNLNLRQNDGNNLVSSVPRDSAPRRPAAGSRVRNPSADLTVSSL